MCKPIVLEIVQSPVKTSSSRRTIRAGALIVSLLSFGRLVGQTGPSVSPLRGAHLLCEIDFHADTERPAQVPDAAKTCLQLISTNLLRYPSSKVLLIGFADSVKDATGKNGKSRMVEDETGEDLRYVDIAAYRAINTKAYLVDWMRLSPTRIIPRSTNEDGQVTKAFLIPGDTFVDMQFPWTIHIFEEPCTIKPCFKPTEEHMHAQHRKAIK